MPEKAENVLQISLILSARKQILYNVQNYLPQIYFFSSKDKREIKFNVIAKRRKMKGRKMKVSLAYLDHTFLACFQVFDLIQQVLKMKLIFY